MSEHQPNNVSAAGVLQPCPFCGGKAVLNALGTHASCSKCTFLPQLFISEWNRRAAASAQAMGQAVQFTPDQLATLYVALGHFKSSGSVKCADSIMSIIKMDRG